MRYSKHREEILNIIKNSDSHPTVEDIYISMREKIPNISLGTVYRNISILYEMGLIKKIPLNNRPDRFDKTLTNHYHMICKKCNQVYDIFSDELNMLNKNISNEVGHNIESSDITFYGICHECNLKEGK
ncbi:MAG: transcriptional repressor [Clostridia bacterium]